MFKNRRNHIQTTGRAIGSQSLQVESLECRQMMSSTPWGADVPVPQPRIINGTSTSAYAAVGIVNDGCTGTLISPTHVLTAAHCTEGVSDQQGSFAVNGRTFSTTEITDHPQYNSNRFDAGYDISIMELSQAVTGIAPMPIYRQVPQVGQVLTLVGFGEGGPGNGGGQGDFGNKRVGTTPIDEVTELHIGWNFDNNSESNTAPGDSGGPAFLTISGQQYIAGITSGGSNDDASIGDFSFDTRVDVFANWIDSVVGQVAPNPSPNPSPNPEPTPNPNPQPNPPPVPAQDDHGDSVDTATPLSLQNGSGVIQGVLEDEGDRDYFRFDVANESNVTIALSETDGSLDTFLRLYDSAGRLVASNDDFGDSFNSRVDVDLPAGQYFVSAAAYDDSEAGDYQLRIDATTQGTPDDVFTDVTELELNERGRVRVRDQVQAGQSEVYSLQADQDGQLVIDARAISWNLDTMLTVYDAEGNEVAFNDDSRGTLDSRIVLDVAAGDLYYVEVSSYGETAGRYLLSAALRSQPRFDTIGVPAAVDWLFANRTTRF